MKWYVKLNKTSGDYVPVGTVVAYAGPVAASLPWETCVGQAFSPGGQPALFAVIGNIHGGDGVTSYYAPDYRGQFLRGVDDGAGRDPDAATRTRPGPNNTGQGGNATGSVQGYGTVAPKGTVTVSIPHLPPDNVMQTAAAIKGNTVYAAPYGKSGQSFSANTLGDHESRPVNVYVQWIICVTS